MAQQTQIDRVIPKFLEFIQRFPTIEALAAAPEEDVLASWSGLGYYRRARLLHSAVSQVAEAGRGLPSTPDELQELPGIGPYTAAAVASLAFDVPVPVLDGNIYRVGARVLGVEGDPRRVAASEKIRDWVGSFFTWAPAGSVNEALMELGALRCTPSSPRCEGCPFEDRCVAHRDGLEEEIPAPRATRQPEHQVWVAACLCRSDGALFLRRIDSGNLLRGLWLPPIAHVKSVEELQEAASRLMPSAEEPFQILPPLRHSITYRRMQVYPVVSIPTQEIAAAGEGEMWFLRGGSQIPSSSLLEKIFSRLEQGGACRNAAF